MQVIGPEDASQIAAMISRIRSGVSPKEALRNTTFHHDFARQVARGIAGLKVSKAAQRTADQLRTLTHPPVRSA